MVSPRITVTDIERENPCPNCDERNYQIDFRCMGDEVQTILLFCPCGWECRRKERADELITYTVELTE